MLKIENPKGFFKSEHFIKRKSQGKLHKLYFLLWDGPDWLSERAVPSDRSPVNLFWCKWLNRWAYIGDPGCWVLCKIMGHQPIDDQCMMPEHRYCLWCHAPQPNREEKNYG